MRVSRLTFVVSLIITLLILTRCSDRLPSAPTGPSLPPEALAHVEQVFEIVDGTGPEVSPLNVVEVHYAIWLLDQHPDDDESCGFLNTGCAPTALERPVETSVGGAPLRFVVGTGEVLPGIDEGVRGMQVGGRRRFRVPSELAFGKLGACCIGPRAMVGQGKQIAPYTSLDVELEVLSLD